MSIVDIAIYSNVLQTRHSRTQFYWGKTSKTSLNCLLAFILSHLCLLTAKCVCALSEWAQKQIHVETILAAVAMWIGVIVIVNRQPCLWRWIHHGYFYVLSQTQVFQNSHNVYINYSTLPISVLTKIAPTMSEYWLHFTAMVIITFIISTIWSP